MSLPPPLIVSPIDKLDKDDYEAFKEGVKEIGNAGSGAVIPFLFPISMFHRIDGLWIPVADLGSFNDPNSVEPVKKQHVESTYRPKFEIDND